MRVGVIYVAVVLMYGGLKDVVKCLNVKKKLMIIKKPLEKNMRIIAGRHRGRKINTPIGLETRPSSSRVRENLFNILTSLDNNFFHDKNILDLFAGSGALGFEAISRGACSALFVEIADLALKAIKKNNVGLAGQKLTHILRADAIKGELISNYVQQNKLDKFDIIFADPPYNKNLGEFAFQQVLHYNLAKQNSIFILEESRKADISFPAQFNVIKKCDYGHTSLYICILETN